MEHWNFRLSTQAKQISILDWMINKSSILINEYIESTFRNLHGLFIITGVNVLNKLNQKVSLIGHLLDPPSLWSREIYTTMYLLTRNINCANTFMQPITFYAGKIARCVEQINLASIHNGYALVRVFVIKCSLMYRL